MGRFAAGLAAVLVALAFGAAYLTQDNGSMSLSPPPSAEAPAPGPDVVDARVLHTAAYTAWAALILVIPAFVAFPFRLNNAGAGRVWLAFWAAGCAAFVVHMLYSMGVFFGWDFDWMRNTTRVSAFWPGMLVLVWWPLDLALAFAGVRGAGVQWQRVALTLVLFVLFVGGSAGTGELLLVRVIGGVLFVAMLFALALRFLGRRA